MTQKDIFEIFSAIAEASFDQKILDSFKTDASIFEVTPSLILFPKNVNELREIVKKAAELSTNTQTKVTLSPRAAGTCMSGGSLTEGIMIDMRPGFSTIGEITTDENGQKSVWVGMGTYYRDLEKENDKHDLLFPAYTSSKDLCGLGGMIGNNASGEKSLRYGATVDNVLSLKMVCIDGNEYEFNEVNEAELAQKISQQDFEGNLYRELSTLIHENWDIISAAKPKTRKNAAGYGLWNAWNPQTKTFSIAKLIIGSQGTLGVVTEAKLKLVPRPHFAHMIVLTMESLTRLAEAVQTMRSFNPEGMETFDGNTYNYAKKFLPQFTALTPHADGKTIILFGQFTEDTEEATVTKAKACVEALAAKGFDIAYITDNAEQEAYWQIRRHGYSLLRDHAENSRAVPFIEDTIVPIDHFYEYIEGFEKVLTEYDIKYGFHGHIGDGSLRIIPLVDMEQENAPNIIFEVAKKVYHLAESFGGSMSVDHNDGLIRTPFLKDMFGEKIVSLFERVKNTFDPEHLFNPGKKVGGQAEYSKAHMIRHNTL